MIPMPIPVGNRVQALCNHVLLFFRLQVILSFYNFFASFFFYRSTIDMNG